MSIQLVAWALSQNIPHAGQKLVLIALANAANSRNGDACFPSKRQLAEDTSMSERTIIRHVNWLEEHGFVRVDREQSADDGRTLANRYSFLTHGGDKLSGGGDMMTPQGDTGVRGEGDTVVTPLIEREYKQEDTSPLTPKGGAKDSASLRSQSSKGSKRGSRIDPEWSPSQADIDFAKSQGLSDGQITDQAGRFRDYWIARPGAGGVKLDWRATWRNWVRSAVSRMPGRGSEPPTRQPHRQHVPAGINYRFRLEQFFTNGTWPDTWGRRPDEPGFGRDWPPDVLRDFSIQIKQLRLTA